MVRNIRRSMVEYHDILWDIGYAKTWEEGTSAACVYNHVYGFYFFLLLMLVFVPFYIATLNLDQLYSERPPIEDFYAWRDERVIDECLWYGWFIDYVSQVVPFCLGIPYHAHLSSYLVLNHSLLSGWKEDSCVTYSLTRLQLPSIGIN